MIAKHLLGRESKSFFNVTDAVRLDVTPALHETEDHALVDIMLMTDNCMQRVNMHDSRLLLKNN